MIISKTPLRMSFFGGGTDFADYYKNSRYGYGTVISTALDMYVYIMVCKRFDDKIRVCYTVNEFVDSVDQIKHNIIREALKMLGIGEGDRYCVFGGYSVKLGRYRTGFFQCACGRSVKCAACL